MITDLLVLAAVVLYAFLGWYTGTMKQAIDWCGMALGRALAQPAALLISLSLARDYEMPSLSSRIGIAVFCFFAFYIIGTLIADFLLKRFIAHRMHTRLDKTGGCVLGAGKGAVLTSVVLSLIVCFQKPLAAAFGRPPRIVSDSLFMGLAGRFNFLGLTPLAKMERLARLMDAMRDPNAVKAMSGDPEMQAIFKDPRLKASLQNDRLAAAIKKGDWAALKEDPRIATLIEDPRIMGILSDPLDWGQE